MTQPLTHTGAPPSGRKKRKEWYRSPWLLAIAPIAAVALFVTGAYGFRLIAPRLREMKAAAGPPQSFSVTGFMALKLGGFIWSSDANVCSGKGGYDDIRAGAQVVITDASDTTVAIGALEPGVPQRDPGNASYATQCRFPFKVTDVPGGHEFYGIEVSKRGKLQYAREKLAQPLEFTLG